jgi:hypothetical protein
MELNNMYLTKTEVSSSQHQPQAKGVMESP